MREYPQSTVDILTRSPILAEIVYKVDQLAKLNRIIFTRLDPELARYCRVANCRDGILVLTTHSPATGHLLRFSEMDLLSTLRADPHFCHLKSIKTHVRPSITQYSASVKPALPEPWLTPTGAEILRSAAKQVDCSNLKKALLKLASRDTAK
jgi:hypothetical protein